MQIKNDNILYLDSLNPYKGLYFDKILWSTKNHNSMSVSINTKGLFYYEIDWGNKSYPDAEKYYDDHLVIYYSSLSDKTKLYFKTKKDLLLFKLKYSL